MGPRTLQILGGLAAAAAAFGLRGRVLDTAMPAGAMPTIDFKDLSLTEKPNQYLTAPEGVTKATPHEIAPEFPFPVEELEKRWRSLMERTPRVELIRDYSDGKQADFVVRSFLWRFPDIVTVRFLGLGDGRSTLAVYARAVYGHSDLGANKRRTLHWLDELVDP